MFICGVTRCSTNSSSQAPTVHVVEAPVDTTRSMLVEFDDLDLRQRMLVDLHELRALRAVDLRRTDAGTWIAGYWLRKGRSLEQVFGEIREWADGHGLPVRRLAQC